MLKPLVAELKVRFKGIEIYDRNAEANQPPSDHPYPPIPQVADINVFFSSRGSKEVANMRCFHRHSCFNYDMKETTAGSKREENLLKSMLNAIDFFLQPPEG